MRKIKFWKMSGAGNDFVLLEGPPRPAAELRRLARRLCARGTGVGADGLLEAAGGRGALRIRYFNSDGSEAFCGNGTRCAALWARLRGLAGRRMKLRTAAGELAAVIAGPGRVRVQMPDVTRVSLRHPGKYPPGIKAVHFLDTGVPHAVVPVSGLEAVDVARAGRLLRHNRAFGPAGANVDFAEARGGKVFVRTYERGVEAETLACGTGVAAAAVALVLAGAARQPVKVVTRGGDRFTVSFDPGPHGARGILLEGPARLVFEGAIEI